MKRFLRYLSNWSVAIVMLFAIAFPVLEHGFSVADSEASKPAQNAQDPLGEVTYPIKGEHVRSTVDIRGSVHDKDIKSYKVIVSKKLSDNIKCSENTSTDNKIVFNTGFIKSENLHDKVLASFDSTTVQDGQYFIYLCVRDEDHPQNQVKVDNGPKGFVIDNTAPVITAPDVTAYTNNILGTVVNYAVTASDAIDGNIPVNCVPAKGSLFPVRVTTVNCTATDSIGNTSNASFTINVILSDAPPVLNLPANITGVEATSAAGAVVNFSATAVDAIDGPVPVTCTPASGSTFPIGTTTVNCSATDSANNTANGSFTVQVVDTIAPVISGTPADFSVEATSVAGAVANYVNPTAVDVVDGFVPVNCIPSSGSIFPLGPTTVTCTATDSHGNSSSTTFIISVVDSTPPFLSIQSPLSNSFVRGLVNVRATASDPNTGISGVTFKIIGQTGDINMPLFNALTGAYRYSGYDTTLLPDGSYDFSFTATNNYGLTSTFQSTNVIVDNTRPTASVTSPVGGVHARATIPIMGSINDTYIKDYKVLVTNSSSGITCGDTTADPNVVFNTLWIPSGNLVNSWLTDFDTTTVSDGQYFVFLCARDQAGNRIRVSNTASGGFIVDNTAPVINGTPLPDITAEATGPGGAMVTYVNPTATDAIDGSIPVICLPASGSLFGITTTLVTCTATDTVGNSSSSTFNITVVDTTPPTLTLPANITGVEATGPSGAVVNFVATAIDIVDGSVAVTCLPASGSTFVIGLTTVNCSATDSHSNTGSGSFTVQVVDTTAPVIAAHSNITVDATSSTGAVVSYISPSATDIVDGVFPATCSPISGSTFAIGTTTITCNAVDSHGNNALPTTFTITVNPLPVNPDDNTSEDTNDSDQDTSSNVSDEQGVLNINNNGGKVKTNDEQNNQKNNDKKDDGSSINWWWWVLLLVVGAGAGFIVGQRYRNSKDS